MVDAISLALPEAEMVFATDPENFPYASKNPDEIWECILPIFEGLVAEKCDAIVVACNTVSTTLIGRIRERFSDTPFIALDPMIKPAAQLTESKVICVCATPATLASTRYNDLKDHYAKQIKVIQPDCSDWSRLIEENRMNEQKIAEDIEPALEAGADVIVLACTHYHWIEEEIKALAKNRAEVIQPEQAVLSQLMRVLERAA